VLDARRRPAADDDPRARAARTKRDRTRRALLDAADSTFGSRGWARTRMEDIAQAAGVSAASHVPATHALSALEMSTLVANLLLLRSLDRPGETPQTTAELLLTVIFGALRPELLIITAGDQRPFRCAQ
jgi:hypothetical protein